MIRNALAVTLILYLVLVGTVLKECVFLAPYKVYIWHHYHAQIICFSLGLVLNVFSGVYMLLRRLALKDTGDKLSHLEKQLRGTRTISEELTERIMERK